jgi:signal-transduction protein with cAMP-binding, CBS, and nucleotidyltransferase domain
MKLVNVKSTMLKTPDQRSKKEIEYICLYLRHHFEIFADIEKEDLKNIMKRLEPEIYPPGQMFGRADKKCLHMTLIIEGAVDAVDKYDPSNMKDYGE